MSDHENGDVDVDVLRNQGLGAEMSALECLGVVRLALNPYHPQPRTHQNRSVCGDVGAFPGLFLQTLSQSRLELLLLGALRRIEHFFC